MNEEAMRHIFISPHMDDVVLSAGDHILKLVADMERVMVITVFTDFGREPLTLSARKYVFSSGFLSLKNFAAERKKEDVDAMNDLSVDFVHLGFIDALFRKREKTTCVGSALACLGCGPVFVYPWLRDVLSGSVSPEDTRLVDRIFSRLSKIVLPGDVIYSPLALGNHVDHVIIRELVLSFPHRKYFWADQPYSSWSSSEIQLRGLEGRFKEEIIVESTEHKKNIFKRYSSQIRCLFKGEPEFRDEIFYASRG